MKRPRTWLLLADGGSARLVRQLRADLETGERLEDLTYLHEQKPLRRIMSDRPGRSFSSTSRRRSAMEYNSDPVRDRERSFARQITKELSELLENHAFDRLIIAAEPRMLGHIRDALGGRLRAVVADEIAKDFVKLPHNRLVEAIAASTTITP